MKSDQNLRDVTHQFAFADDMYAYTELAVTIAGFSFSIVCAYVSYTHSFWILYAIAIVLAGLFSVKMFTIQHDCGHESYLSKPKANIWVGRLCSLFMTMPFSAWKTSHAIHHGHVGNIEKISEGDVELLTVSQYKVLSVFQKFVYIVRRNPFFHIFFAPFIYFVLMSKAYNVLLPEYRTSTLLTDMVTLCLFALSSFLIGFWTTIFIFVPPIYIGGIIGVVLFYLQHNFPSAECSNDAEWNYQDASLKSSSLIILPQPFEWFTHSIGYHPVHHLNSKVPGYKLKSCFKKINQLEPLQPLTVTDAIKSFALKLWSHDKKALVSFSEASNLLN